MARAQINTLGWGVLQDAHGTVQPNVPFTITGSVYSAATGAARVSQLVSDANGRLPGFMDDGLYTLTVAGTSYAAPVSSGGTPLNVKTFGVQGDGVTDDTAALNLALASGGSLVVPAGTYKVTGLTAPAAGNVDVRCQAGAVFDMSAAGTSAAFLTATGSVVTGGTGYHLLNAPTTVGATFVSIAAGGEADYKRGDLVQIGSEDYFELRSAANGAGTGQKLGEFAEVLSTSSGVVNFVSALVGGWTDSAGVDHLTYTVPAGAFIRKVTPIENVNWSGGTLRGKFGRNLTGTITTGSAIVTGITPTTDGIVPGMPVTGSGIPLNTTVTSIDSGTQVTLSAPSTPTVSPQTVALSFNPSSQTGIAFTFAQNCHVSDFRTEHVAALGVQFLGSLNCSARDLYLWDAWGGTGYGCAASAGSQDITFTNVHAHDCRHAFTTGAPKDTYGPARRITLTSCHAWSTLPTTGDQFDTHACSEEINFDGCSSTGSGGAGFNIECSSATITNCRAEESASSGFGLTNHTFAPGSYVVSGSKAIRPNGIGIKVSPGFVVLAGITTSGSPVVTALARTTGFTAGQGITSAAFPAGTTILSVDSATQVTMSANATVTGQQVTGTTVIGSPQITGSSYTDPAINLASLAADPTAVPPYAGAIVTGAGIPGATHLLSVDSDTQLTVDKNATAAGTVTLSINAASVTFWRANDWRGVRIESNEIYKPLNSDGIDIMGQKGSEIHGLVVTGNVIDRPGNANVSLWVKYANGLVNGNVIRRIPANNLGLRLEQCTKLLAYGNRISYETAGTGKGISLIVLISSLVTDNVVLNGGTGINVDDNCNDNTIKGNDVSICTTPIVVGNGLRNVIRDNAGQAFKRTAISYTVLPGDVAIAVTSTAAARTITLPATASTATDQILIVKDESGAAGTNNITITRAGADTIETATTLVINTNYGVKRLYLPPSSTDWKVL